MKNIHLNKTSFNIIIFSIVSLILIISLKKYINQVSGLAYILSFISIVFIGLNIAKLFNPRNVVDSIFYNFLDIVQLLIIVLIISFTIYILYQYNFINTKEQFSPASIGSGIIAIISLWFFYQRNKYTSQQIDIQIHQRVDERFNSAISLLGSKETSTRTGAIYGLFELAIDEEKYRKQIVQILCSHIRSKTNESEYQKLHKDRPSNEIQTTINLLFKENNNGLYTQDFAKEKDFPIADLSYSYLVGADFMQAQCQNVIFDDVICQNANFSGANCNKASFLCAKCQECSFDGDCQWCNFEGADLQLTNFTNANLESAKFSNSKCQGACFYATKIYSAKFREANIQGACFSFSNYNDAIFEGGVTKFAKAQGTVFVDTEACSELKDRIINKDITEGAPKGCISGVLEDSDELQAIINKDWDKLAELQKAE